MTEVITAIGGELTPASAGIPGTIGHIGTIDNTGSTVMLCVSSQSVLDVDALGGGVVADDTELNLCTIPMRTFLATILLVPL